MFIFFFFQAEDGIRDFHVTGVQTCALPICHTAPRGLVHPSRRRARRAARPAGPRRPRSEERRVGKECRSRWSPSQYKKNDAEAASSTPVAVIIIQGSLFLHTASQT